MSGYDLFANNCEHFATWWVTGEHSSTQVEAAISGAGVVGVGAVVPPFGVGTVASIGEAAAMSGPNLMSGRREQRSEAPLWGALRCLVQCLGCWRAGPCAWPFETSPRPPTRSARLTPLDATAPSPEPPLARELAVHAIGALGVVGYSADGFTSGLAGLPDWRGQAWLAASRGLCSFLQCSPLASAISPTGWTNGSLQGVIIVYANDWRDTADVRRILKTLRRAGLAGGWVHFKRDRETLAGAYGVRGHRGVSVWNARPGGHDEISTKWITGRPVPVTDGNSAEIVAAIELVDQANSP